MEEEARYSAALYSVHRRVSGLMMRQTDTTSKQCVVTRGPRPPSPPNEKDLCVLSSPLWPSLLQQAAPDRSLHILLRPHQPLSGPVSPFRLSHPRQVPSPPSQVPSVPGQVPSGPSDSTQVPDSGLPLFPLASSVLWG